MDNAGAELLRVVFAGHYRWQFDWRSSGAPNAGSAIQPGAVCRAGDPGCPDVPLLIGELRVTFVRPAAFGGCRE